MTKNEARVLALKLRKNGNTMLESEKTIKAIVESNILCHLQNIHPLINVDKQHSVLTYFSIHCYCLLG